MAQRHFLVVVGTGPEGCGRLRDSLEVRPPLRRSARRVPEEDASEVTSHQAAALLVIAALAAGCSSGASSAVQPSSPASSAPADPGKVTVRLGVVYAGGPAGTSPVLRSGM